MPSKQPTIHVERVRNIAEAFSWRDPNTKLLTQGFNPPAKALEVKRVPFHVKYVTKAGRLEEGNCICINVDRRKGMRRVMFVDSHQFRWIYDILIIEINGFRVING